ncbi:MAG: DUF4167 domain-containing protein [Silicimonas sp.]|nr:DUF4167 domain-containing protein [Silicimonas sp.]
MRSSKSRSRKSNRSNNRQVGNIVNRVFDSSGPEGKVRGTPQQIIEKYNQLARDSQLSGDRVATENFQQHAEHYLRMLAEAQKEQAERQAQQQANQQNQQNNQNNQNNPNNQQTPNQQNAQNNQQDRQNDQPRANQRRQERAPEQKSEAPRDVKSDDVIDVTPEADAGLVETPEDKPQKPKRTRKKAAPEVVADAPPVDTAPPDAAE